MKDGGPAFPVHEVKIYSQNPADSGMGLRDYFAAAALPVVIAAYNASNLPAIGTDHILRNCPIIAYQFADAMLAAREEAPNEPR